MAQARTSARQPSAHPIHVRHLIGTIGQRAAEATAAFVPRKTTHLG
ncbi:hypothetical protein ACTMTJ_32390 [Phytohabitans sp. LJ34]